MRNLNKVIAGIFLMFGALAIMSYNSQASVVARAPKAVSLLSYSTIVSSITPFTVLQATSTLEPQPGAIYSLIMSSGPLTGDYLVLFDTIPFTTAGLAAANVTSAYMLCPKIMYTSTSTVIVFDPPLLFKNGLLAANSAATEQVGIVWEPGRGLSGQ